MASNEPSKAIIIGISGVSSSGKTTLARLLRDIFPRTFILHEDDFYKPDAQIPMHPVAKVADWDCLEALDLDAMKNALQHIRQHGTTPPDFSSKEDMNSVGDGAKLNKEVVEDERWRATRWMFADAPPIAIIDGFLLYSEEMRDVRERLDVKLLLSTDFKTVKARREARKGYVTLEGFWEDPPGYVDEVVWPNYVKDHAFLFVDGDVEGEPDERVLEELEIRVQPRRAKDDMTECLKWASGLVDAALTRFTER